MADVTTHERLVDDDLIEAFRRDGFVVVPDLLSDDEVDHYGRVVTDAVHERNAGDDVPLEKKRIQQQIESIRQKLELIAEGQE